MLYLDKETGSFKTKSQLLKELKCEADAFSGDGYKVSARKAWNIKTKDRTASSSNGAKKETK